MGLGTGFGLELGSATSVDRASCFAVIVSTAASRPSAAAARAHLVRGRGRG